MGAFDADYIEKRYKDGEISFNEYQKLLQQSKSYGSDGSGGSATNRFIATMDKIFNAIGQGQKEATQPIWERDSTVEVFGEEKAAEFKETVESIPEKITDAIDQGFKESTQPIWERDSTVEVFGEDGADKMQDVLNPARWAENAIEETPLSPENKDALKKYLPVAVLGAGALFLLSALK